MLIPLILVRRFWMNFDWFANYNFNSVTDIDKCVEGKDGFDKVSDMYSRTKLLSICLHKEDIKNYAKSGERINNPKGHKFIIHRNKYNKLIEREIERLKSTGLYLPSADISKLPLYSFFLQFTFTLATPYLSKDDEEFYICDNPVMKDKVFKIPMVSGSTWKGNLRWTTRQLMNLNPGDPDEPEIVRLFGNEKRQDEYFRRGRLNFYSTFFNQISLEVINPHDRKTKAGTQPIYIESVPEDAQGTFSLLYLPFDLMGRPSEQAKKEVSEDLDFVYKALKDMMLTYGFSAKKSCGFGIVKNEITDLIINDEKVKPEQKKQNKQKGKGVSLDEFKEIYKQQSLREPETHKITFDNLSALVNEIIRKILISN
jgi:CRISPR-associated protein Cmr2